MYSISNIASDVNKKKMNKVFPAWTQVVVIVTLCITIIQVWIISFSLLIRNEITCRITDELFISVIV